MEHLNNKSSSLTRRKLWMNPLHFMIYSSMLVRFVHSDESVTVPGNGNAAAAAGSLLCISDCETCPIICSPSTSSTPPIIPTPRPSVSLSPPTIIPSTPPALPILFPPPSSPSPQPPSPPLQPVHHHRNSPPAQPYYFPSPTPESSSSSLPYYNSPPASSGNVAPPPPSFVSWNGDGTFPPPSIGYMPLIQTPPANGMNQRNYSYPYYYYYASKASSYSFPPLLLLLLLLSCSLD